MINAKLSIVPAEETSDEPTLRARVDEIAEGHRQIIISAVSKWLVYWAELGARKLCLDECPGIGRADHDCAIEWLRSEGFTVRSGRFFGRTVVELRPVVKE